MKVLTNTRTKWISALAAMVCMTLLILYFCGMFSKNVIEPGVLPLPEGLPAPQHQAEAVLEDHPVWYEAVGTIQSRTQATVAPQVTGRILEIAVDAGDPVKVGALLAMLDDQEVKARLEQARSMLDSALARQEQAEANFTRIEKLFEQKAATSEQLEAALSEKKQAQAARAVAAQKIKEAEVSMGYTRIDSPMDGILTSRLADPGDLAWPGKPLFEIHDPKALRLEAHVREGLIQKVKVNDSVSVYLASKDLLLQGTINEIIPSADPVSRSFLVKVTLPEAEGLYPGMFGKLRLRLGERSAIVIPERAVETIGQLNTVLVDGKTGWSRRYITLGEGAEGKREILSGLSGGEKIGWNDEVRHGK